MTDYLFKATQNKLNLGYLPSVKKNCILCGSVLSIQNKGDKCLKCRSKPLNFICIDCKGIFKGKKKRCLVCWDIWSDKQKVKVF